jgi:hypothetical protein
MPTLQMTAVELFFAASQQPTLLLHLPSTADLKLLLRAFKGCKGARRATANAPWRTER